MDNDSPEDPNQESCIICFYKIKKDMQYAMIDNVHEKGKYHIPCLENWLTKSQNGLLSQDKIKGYKVYFENEVIETVILGETYQKTTVVTSNHYEPPTNWPAIIAFMVICLLAGLFIFWIFNK